MIKLQLILNALLLVSASHSGKLSEEENKDRLSSCGNVHLETPSDSNASANVKPANVALSKNGQWFYLTARQYENGIWYHISGASAISKRHVLTTSRVVMSSKRKWRANNQSVDCKGDLKYVEVPAGFLEKNMFRRFQCVMNGTDCHDIATPVKAYILNYCPNMTEHVAYHPMIIEFDDTFTNSTPCLSDEVNIGNGVYVHGYEDNGNGKNNGVGLKHRLLWVIDLQEKLVITESFHGEYEFGSPLSRVIGRKWTIVGLGTTYMDFTSNVFFRMKWFQDGICEVAGICGSDHVYLNENSEASSTTTFMPNASETATSIPTSTTNSVQSPTSTGSSVKVSITPEPEDERGTEKIEKTEETEKPDQDVDDTLYFGEDFLNGVGRVNMELAILVLCVMI